MFLDFNPTPRKPNSELTTSGFVAKSHSLSICASSLRPVASVRTGRSEDARIAATFRCKFFERMNDRADRSISIDHFRDERTSVKCHVELFAFRIVDQIMLACYCIKKIQLKAKHNSAKSSDHKPIG